MRKKFILQVKQEDSGLRVDVFLNKCGNDFILTRTHAQKIIQLGCVSKNRECVKKPSTTVLNEDQLEITLPAQESVTTFEPWDKPLDILYEDAHLLVVNKPSGIPTHPSLGHKSKTLVNALIHHSTQLSNVNTPERPGIVHRLDLHTSGLMVVAKTNETHIKLAEQFETKSIQRKYYALVYGLVSPLKETVVSYLHRDPRNRKKFSSIKNFEKQKSGKKAITHYKVITKTFCDLSLLECQLETGRTHQIRIHLSEKGHGILGDPLYGRPKLKLITEQKIRKLIQNLDRLALWAFDLHFIHPILNKSMCFQIQAPKNLKPLLEALNIEQI